MAIKDNTYYRKFPFFGGHLKNKIVLRRSSDFGETLRGNRTIKKNKHFSNTV